MSTHRDAREGGRPPRVRHPLRLIGFTVIIAVLIAGAFVAGQFVRAPYGEALENVSAEVEVLAEVEERVVDNGFSLPATVAPARTVDLIVTEAPSQAAPVAATTQPKESDPSVASPSDVAAQTPEVERLLVSASKVAPGDIVGIGTLTGEVSGRPIFAWSATSPLYRDLLLGMTGSDVRGVQQVLSDLDYRGVRVSGTVDSGTLDALSRLYRSAGYELPFVQDGIRGLSWREFVALPVEGAIADWVAPVGSVLGAEQPLLKLKVADAALAARASVLDVDQLAAGTEVGVAIDGAAPVLSTVLSSGEFEEADDASPAGYPISVAVPEGLTDLDRATTITVRAWGTPAPSRALPAIAVRQDGDRSYVLLPRKGAADEDEDHSSAEVTITVIAEAGGWVSIESSDELPVGTAVVVSG